MTTLTDAIMDHMIITQFEKNLRRLTKANVYVFIDKTREVLIIDLWLRNKDICRFEISNIYGKLWVEGKTIPVLSEKIIARYKERIFDEYFYKK